MNLKKCDPDGHTPRQFRSMVSSISDPQLEHDDFDHQGSQNSNYFRLRSREQDCSHTTGTRGPWALMRLHEFNG